MSQAIDRGLYGPWVPATAAERAASEQVFPTGVCDFTQPGAGRPASCSIVAVPGEEVGRVDHHDDEPQFNQDTGGAKQAAQAGPVYVTDRRRVSFVLLSFEAYERLSQDRASIVDLLAGPPGVEDVEVEVPAAADRARPASFD